MSKTYRLVVIDQLVVMPIRRTLKDLRSELQEHCEVQHGEMPHPTPQKEEPHASGQAGADQLNNSLAEKETGVSMDHEPETCPCGKAS